MPLFLTDQSYSSEGVSEIQNIDWKSEAVNMSILALQMIFLIQK